MNEITRKRVLMFILILSGVAIVSWQLGLRVDLRRDQVTAAPGGPQGNQIPATAKKGLDSPPAVPKVLASSDYGKGVPGEILKYCNNTWDPLNDCVDLELFVDPEAEIMLDPYGSLRLSFRPYQGPTTVKVFVLYAPVFWAGTEPVPLDATPGQDQIEFRLPRDSGTWWLWTQAEWEHWTVSYAFRTRISDGEL